MRKKLDTRFPASRIKKIMQADDDVGKIALAVPVLVSKALELFLQDLCDRTYEITLQRGAKTVSSLHLKQCVQSFSVFDFLKDIVSRVPDMGSSDAGCEEKASMKRRRVLDDEDPSDEEPKRSRIHEAGHSSGSGRGRGRGRRGRGRPRTIDRDSLHADKFEDDPDMSLEHQEKPEAIPIVQDGGSESKLDLTASSSDAAGPVRNFDLNAEVDNSAEKAEAAVKPAAEPDANHEEYPGWSDQMTIDPVQLAQLNRRVDEEEDYDAEG